MTSTLQSHLKSVYSEVSLVELDGIYFLVNMFGLAILNHMLAWISM